MAQLQPQYIREFSSGMTNLINEFIAPPNSVELAVNLDFDYEFGTPTSRLGTAVVNTQLENNETILGLHDFRYGTASGKLLAAVNAAGGASSVVTDVGADTNVVTGLTADAKMRFVTYLDSVLMINGADAERSYNGTTVITTGGAFDLANIPSSNTVDIGIEWRDRVYLAGDTTEPSRLYYSTVPSSGSVAWTTGDAGNIDIEPEDGAGVITGLGKVPGYLLIFKERSMKRWNFDNAFPESLINIGTPSHESIINAAGLCAFFSASSQDAVGFYITNGGRPIPISHDVPNNIKKWVDAIPAAYHVNISGWGNSRNFFWSIGDVTVDDVAYTNVVVKWNLQSKVWSVRTYPSEFRVWSSYVNSSTNKIVAGDDDGNVIEIDAASTYDDYPSNTPINWRLETREEDFKFNQVKQINERIIIQSRNARNAHVYVHINGGDPIALGTITNDVSELKLPQALKGNYFKFVIAGNPNGGRSKIKQIELPNIEILENVYDIG